MPFITQDDYYHKIKERHLLQIIEDEPDILTDAEATAMAVIENKLFQRYDMDEVFAQVDDARSRVVLRWLICLVLYYIYERIDDDLVPERIVKNYDDCINEIDEVSAGNQPVKLPLLEEDADGDGEPDTIARTRVGSETPRDLSLNY